MSETVTEGQYTRAYIASCMLILASVVTTTGIAVSESLDMMLLLSLFTVAFYTLGAAVVRHGISRRLWGWMLDTDVALDDIDTDDFSDGPVEVDT